MGLAGDLAAGVEDAGDDGGIDIGHVTLERRGAVHHRHPGEADVVLEHDPLARELAAGGAGDGRLHIPGVQRVLVGIGAMTRGARIGDLGNVVGQRIERCVVIAQGRRHHAAEFGNVVLTQRQAEVVGDGF